MKKFNHPDFQTQLNQVITELEQDSQIEVVVMIKQRSANYEDIPIALGAISALAAFSYLFYFDPRFADYIACLITLVAFELGMLLSLALPMTQHLCATKKRQQRNVEIMARALFQKGGLHQTSAGIGTLIYCSLLEKIVYIVADSGAQMAIPEDEWRKITLGLQSIFKSKMPATALLKELEKCKLIFSRYVPASENNINELPNTLQVDL